MINILEIFVQIELIIVHKLLAYFQIYQLPEQSILNILDKCSLNDLNITYKQNTSNSIPLIISLKKNDNLNFLNIITKLLEYKFDKNFYYKDKDQYYMDVEKNILHFSYSNNLYIKDFAKILHIYDIEPDTNDYKYCINVKLDNVINRLLWYYQSNYIMNNHNIRMINFHKTCIKELINMGGHSIRLSTLKELLLK